MDTVSSDQGQAVTPTHWQQKSDLNKLPPLIITPNQPQTFHTPTILLPPAAVQLLYILTKDIVTLPGATVYLARVFLVHS